MLSFDLSPSDVLSIVGVVIGVFGILGTYYFYRKSLRSKVPVWAIISTSLIEGYSSKLSGLKVSYKSKTVENLTISKILFMNEGAETIDGKDITMANPLRIVGRKDDIRLLDAVVLATTQASNQFSVVLTEEENAAHLGFDYLDQKQGAVIQVIHTGTSSLDVEVIGDIKGARSVRRLDRTRRWMQRFSRFIRPIFGSFQTLQRGIGVVSAMGLILLSSLGVLRSILLTNNLVAATADDWWELDNRSAIISYLITLVLGLIFALIYVSELREISKIPKALRVFNQEH